MHKRQPAIFVKLRVGNKNSSIAWSFKWRWHIKISCYIICKRNYQFYFIRRTPMVYTWQVRCHIDPIYKQRRAWVLAMYNCKFELVSYGNTFAASFTHYPIAWPVSHPAVKTRLLTGPLRGLLNRDILTSNIHSNLWVKSPGFVHVTNFLPFER